jgi:hypothetical protein
LCISLRNHKEQLQARTSPRGTVLPPDKDIQDSKTRVKTFAVTHPNTTSFTSVYNCFLGKITDDLYLELTPQDTLRDLQNLLLNAIPGFEFPRFRIDDYVIEQAEKPQAELLPDDLVLEELLDGLLLVDNSYFNCKLTQEEINILALLMMEGWVQRQVSSIEVTRQKYSGTDFKMTSQANHLSKLLSLLAETQRQSLHMQRLYKRRRLDPETGRIVSNWSTFRGVRAIDD